MINNLLPKKENLIPVDNSSMFRECEFKDSFDSLSFADTPITEFKVPFLVPLSRSR